MEKDMKQSRNDDKLCIDPSDRRQEMLTLCYNRLKELIPECTSEVNLLKCIEILEKQERASVLPEDNRDALSVISDTLDRLAALR